jgi:hypothetical protein
MEKNIYELLISLLGKPENDMSFTEFLKRLGKRPDIVDDSKNGRTYSFPEEGIFLRYDKVQGMFELFAFEIAHIPGSPTKPYSGPLPSGIERTDTPSSIESKLGIKALDSNELLEKAKRGLTYTLCYQLPLVLLAVSFESKTNTICGIIVHFRPTESHSGQVRSH